MDRDLVGFAEDFLEAVKRVSDLQSLRELIGSATDRLGFSYFALIHHTDLRRSEPKIIRIENYPPNWTEHFIANRLYLEDPVICASLRSSVGFAWADLPSLIQLTSRQFWILDRGRAEGLGEGYTVPTFIPGDRSASCSFATRPGRPLPPRRNLLAAELFGAFAFEAARRISGLTAVVRASAERLTPRQRECLLLVGRGKSDFVIGQLLGLSEGTVKQYLAAARSRYDVATRAQLIVAAIYDGEIALHELKD